MDTNAASLTSASAEETPSLSYPSDPTSAYRKNPRAGKLFRAPIAHGIDSKAEDFKAHYLLGDWGGVRTQLAEQGIKPSLLFISDPFGNPIGGRDQGFGVYNLLLAELVLETEPLLGWSDGEFHLGYAYTFGDDISSQDVGNVFPIQLAAAGAPDASRLTYLAYQQSLFEEKLSLKAGRVTIINPLIK